MKRTLISVLVTAALTILVAGCALLEGGVTITGTVSGDYFDITSDVRVTITQGEVSFSIPVPLASEFGSQLGAFLIANVPTGDYSVVVTFENGYNYTGGSVYSVDDGTTWIDVDSEVVTGTSAPYLFTITIDSLTIDADETFDVYFGNVG